MTDARNTQTLRQLILGEAAFYDAQMSDLKLKMFVDEMSDMTLEQIHRAYFQLRKDPKRQAKLPMPSEVRQFVNPQTTDENNAITAVNLLISAVSKFGWPNGPEAKIYMGELAWSLVGLNGGWESVCRKLGDSIQETTFKAQLRLDAKVQLDRAKNGMLNLAPGLPEASNDPKLKSLISGMVKAIPK